MKEDEVKAIVASVLARFGLPTSAVTITMVEGGPVVHIVDAAHPRAIDMREAIAAAKVAR